MILLKILARWSGWERDDDGDLGEKVRLEVYTRMDLFSLDPGPSSPLTKPSPRASRCTAIGGMGQIPSAPPAVSGQPFPDPLGLGEPVLMRGDLPSSRGSHATAVPGQLSVGSPLSDMNPRCSSPLPVVFPA